MQPLFFETGIDFAGECITSEKCPQDIFLTLVLPSGLQSKALDNLIENALERNLRSIFWLHPVVHTELHRISLEIIIFQPHNNHPLKVIGFAVAGTKLFNMTINNLYSFRRAASLIKPGNYFS